ncbi:MAG TPA: tetratricopeptide repeat protein, partial [Candidatus Udaeobacter sp.]|nr:tetratricopeptide repeat protein [Candidatus Udaeobacter sp.]
IAMASSEDTVSVATPEPETVSSVPAPAPVHAAARSSAPAAQTPARPTAPAPVVRAPSPAPTTLNDFSAWIDYRTRNHIAALPEEARIFYRRGLLLHQSGGSSEAIRLVRGATELDPDFVAPHLTLAAWFLLRDPSQALLQYAAVLEMLRQSFVVQLTLAANAFAMVLQSLFLGLLAAALLIIAIHNAELRHAWHERMRGFVSGGSARAWAWSFLVLPFAVGVGLTLPAVILLGQLWPALRFRERTLFVALVLMLVAAPWVTTGAGRLAIPLHPEMGPFYGTATLASEPYSTERERDLAELAAAHPGNPFTQFGYAWMARRGGNIAAAEKAYRRALDLWPDNDRVMNNLGNAIAMQGRTDQALALYKRAAEINPQNAAAWFNASQIYTQRFEYRSATDALSRASALNFDLVKSYQSQGTDDGLLALADLWLSPRTSWNALTTLPALPGSAGLPPAWRERIECSGWWFSAAVLLLAITSLALGIALHRGMPLRTCSNCRNVVCRRCARRRRETALCEQCEVVEARAESPDFARMFLAQHRRSVTHRRDMMRTALATLIPGFGLLSTGRVFAPVLLLTVMAALITPWLGLGSPYSYEPRLSFAAAETPVALAVGLWVAIYAISMLGYFTQRGRQRAHESEQDAPVRNRNLNAPARRSDPAAA